MRTEFGFFPNRFGTVWTCSISAPYARLLRQTRNDGENNSRKKRADQERKQEPAEAAASFARCHRTDYDGEDKPPEKDLHTTPHAYRAPQLQPEILPRRKHYCASSRV